MLMSDDEIKIELQSWFGKTEESFINHKPYSGQATEITIYNLGMADWYLMNTSKIELSYWISRIITFIKQYWLLY